MHPMAYVGIVLGVLLVGVMSFLIFAYRRFYKKQHFTCPNCKHEFKPKFLKLIFSPNMISGKIIRCPNCKQINCMEPVNDTIEDEKKS